MTSLLSFPRDAVRADQLQAREAVRVEVLARTLAAEASEDFDVLDRTEQAHLRYLACYVLRARQQTWTRAADRHAKDAVIRTLKTECGSKFAGLPEAQYETYASLLLHAVLSAHRGLLEGSTPMAPGTYLEIVGGEE